MTEYDVEVNFTRQRHKRSYDPLVDDEVLMPVAIRQESPDALHQPVHMQSHQVSGREEAFGISIKKIWSP